MTAPQITMAEMAAREGRATQRHWGKTPASPTVRKAYQADLLAVACSQHQVSISQALRPAKGQSAAVSRARWEWFRQLRDLGLSKRSIARRTGFDWHSVNYGLRQIEESSND